MGVAVAAAAVGAAGLVAALTRSSGDFFSGGFFAVDVEVAQPTNSRERTDTTMNTCFM